MSLTIVTKFPRILLPANLSAVVAAFMVSVFPAEADEAASPPSLVAEAKPAPKAMSVSCVSGRGQVIRGNSRFYFDVPSEFTVQPDAENKKIYVTKVGFPYRMMLEITDQIPAQAEPSLEIRQQQLRHEYPSVQMLEKSEVSVGESTVPLHQLRWVKNGADMKASAVFLAVAGVNITFKLEGPANSGDASQTAEHFFQNLLRSFQRTDLHAPLPPPPPVILE